MSKIVKTYANSRILFVVVGMVVLSQQIIGKGWHGIVPCVSTRLDAEKILTKDFLPDSVDRYRFQNYRVYVGYEKKDKSAPERDIVKKLDVYPDEAEPLAKYIKNIPYFHRDFLRLERDEKVYHVYGEAIYRNWKDGFEIWVEKNDRNVEVIKEFRLLSTELFLYKISRAELRFLPRITRINLKKKVSRKVAKV